MHHAQRQPWPASNQQWKLLVAWSQHFVWLVDLWSTEAHPYLSWFLRRNELGDQLAGRLQGFLRLEERKEDPQQPTDFPDWLCPLDCLASFVGLVRAGALLKPSKFSHSLQVVKAGGAQAKMTHKAHNGRVIVEWLSELTRLACDEQSFHLWLASASPRRTFGKWMLAQMRDGKQPFPTDPKFPFQNTCLLLGWKLCEGLFRFLGQQYADGLAWSSAAHGI